MLLADQLHRRPPLIALLGECNADDHTKSAIARLLVDAGANVTLTAESECYNGFSGDLTPLHADSSPAVFRILLTAVSPADVNVRTSDKMRWTPLHIHALENRPEHCKLLVEAGVSVDALDGRNNTALHWAAKSSCTACMQVLLNANADVNIRDDFGHTALFIAVRQCLCSVLPLLLATGSNACISDNNNQTALTLLQWAPPECVQAMHNHAQRQNACNGTCALCQPGSRQFVICSRVNLLLPRVARRRLRRDQQPNLSSMRPFLRYMHDGRQ